MNDLLQSLGDQLKGTSGGTKFIAVIVCVALVVVIGGTAVVMNGPDFQPAFPELSDQELPKVTKALADAGIPFRTSQPPGPYTVFIDADERTRANTAVYGAGALDKPVRGVNSEGGFESVFASSEERKQGVLKREWEEIEKMLEVLDFVSAATVRTAYPNRSALPDRNTTPRTASVTLRIVDNASLTPGQRNTVANLVSGGLGLSKEHLIISDQFGKNLYDGTASDVDEVSVQELLATQSRYDAKQTEVANLMLRDIFGPRKARVTVTSEWDYAQTTRSREEAVGAGAITMQSKTKTDRKVPSGSSSTDGVGVSANTITSSTNSSRGSSGSAELMTENESDEKTEYQPTIAREDTVEVVPRLERLSIALFLDQSLADDQVLLEQIEGAVKATVGFTEGRDEYRSVVYPFAGAEVSPTGEGEGTDAAPSTPNPLMEKVLRHGLEIGTGLVFLTLLLRSLRKSSAPERRPGTPVGGSTGTIGAEVDAERLAQLELQQLLETDPDKIGKTLTRWIQEDEPLEARR